MYTNRLGVLCLQWWSKGSQSLPLTVRRMRGPLFQGLCLCWAQYIARSSPPKVSCLDTLSSGRLEKNVKGHWLSFTHCHRIPSITKSDESDEIIMGMRAMSPNFGKYCFRDDIKIDASHIYTNVVSLGSNNRHTIHYGPSIETWIVAWLWSVLDNPEWPTHCVLEVGCLKHQ